MRIDGAIIMCTLLLGCSEELSGPPGDSEAPGGGTTGGGEGVGGGAASTGGGQSGDGDVAGDGDGAPVTMEECAAQAELLVGRTLLKRMSRSQYNNTLSDLLGIVGDPAANISPDEKVGPFVSNSRTPITDLLVEQYQESAVQIAEEIAARMSDVAGCDLSLPECSSSFVTSFGRLVYRRPLEPSELDAYGALFQLGAEESTQTGFKLVVETMLQSPFFLYHVDVGPGGVAGAAPSPLTDYELASRLSYFIWDTMPDAELFALAEAGTLNDDAVLAEQVARLLASPRSEATIAGFHRQWLRIGDMSGVEKDVSVFPQYSPQMREAMLAEIGGFSDSIIRSGDGLLSSLFLSTSSPMRSELFSVYGMSPPVDFVEGQMLELPQSERAGILTRAAFLTAQAHRDQTSPVHRGLTIRENVLCQTLESPPPDVANVPPPPSESTTTRERFAAHSESVACAHCHRKMDPIGLGFEAYDPIGAYRSEDGGQPIDATGELLDVSEELLGPFDGAIELSQKLAGSNEVADCVANQWFRFALGRVESNDDACSLLSIREGFSASGHNVRTLIEQIVLSDAFRTVRLMSDEETTP